MKLWGLQGQSSLLGWLTPVIVMILLCLIIIIKISAFCSEDEVETRLHALFRLSSLRILPPSSHFRRTDGKSQTPTGLGIGACVNLGKTPYCLLQALQRGSGCSGSLLCLAGSVFKHFWLAANIYKSKDLIKISSSFSWKAQKSPQHCTLIPFWQLSPHGVVVAVRGVAVAVWVSVP